MPILSQVVACDNAPKCGALKQQANRWWVMVIGHQSVEVYPFDAWVDHRAAGFDREEPVRYYCGRACLTEALSAALEELQKQSDALLSLVS